MNPSNITFYVDLLGWCGTFVYLLAYYLVSTHRLLPDSFTYQGMNLVGGLFLSINAWHHAAWPSLGVNLAWMLIALFVLLRRRNKR